MICENYEWVCGTLQPVPLLFQSKHDGEEFLREECYRINVRFFSKNGICNSREFFCSLITSGGEGAQGIWRHSSKQESDHLMISLCWQQMMGSWRVSHGSPTTRGWLVEVVICFWISSWCIALALRLGTLGNGWVHCQKVGWWTLLLSSSWSLVPSWWGTELWSRNTLQWMGLPLYLSGYTILKRCGEVAMVICKRNFSIFWYGGDVPLVAVLEPT